MDSVPPDITNQTRGSTFDLIWNNLAYAQLWEQLKARDEQVEWQGQTLRIIEGKPPHKLSNDDYGEDEQDQGKEYVLPIEMSQYKAGKLTFKCLDLIFDRMCPPGARRITLALANSDGTVMFYFVYKGIHKPKRN
ncbi:tRNA splicing endonuclease subunit [Zygosaccharomyces mellis]|uniref:tRNA splicing endonuclease subunit n=1 Tax=Zygosaccharomyces mellis TaxID=42258 RepID=A0A4C2EDQ5_9SACH|nr:tRNA splicing endonuclease subunit [Zygosaccharomyces mellis]